MTPRFMAAVIDLSDLAALLHIMSDAAGKRGDADFGRTLRLAARRAEAIGEQLETFSATDKVVPDDDGPRAKGECND